MLREAARGDAKAAAERLEALKGLSVLAVTDEAEVLAEVFIHRCGLPPKAAVDAVHIAVAAVNGMDYLLTWNCTHIANAVFRGRVEDASRDAGYRPPIICTPEELKEP